MQLIIVKMKKTRKLENRHKDRSKAGNAHQMQLQLF